MVNILLVEDDKEIQTVNKNMLKRRGGYEVTLAMTLAGAWEKVRESAPDIIVLDIMLPDGSGLDFLKKLRTEADIPVLLLTARGESGDVVQGLRAGGDDYLAKPYDNDVLLGRIEALLRRAERVPKTVTKGPLTLKVKTMMAYLHGKNMGLQPKEFSLLLALMENEGRIMSAEYIYETVWEAPMNDDARAVQFQISNLRKKLGNSGYSITVKRNEGYIFERE